MSLDYYSYFDSIKLEVLLKLLMESKLLVNYEVVVKELSFDFPFLYYIMSLDAFFVKH